VRIPFIASTLLALFLVPVARAQEPDATQRRVRSIRFAGNKRYSDEFLKQQIITKEGEKYDPGLLRQDERHLREFFSSVLDVESVVVMKESKPTGEVDLIFHVVDRVVVGRVTYTGLTHVKKDDFKDALITRSGRPLLDYGLRRDAEMIARLHREKGYHFVEVRALPRKTGKQDVSDVIFRVVPGPRTKVREVILEGAHSVNKRQLQKLLINSDLYRTQWLGLGNLLNPTYFDEDKLEEDRRRLEFYYRNEGWMDANVALVGYRFEEDNKRAVLHFKIDEGQRYRIRSYSVQYVPDGDPLDKDKDFLSPDNMESLAVFAPGYAYRAEDLERTRLNMRERLWSRAYAKSRVAPDIKVNPLDRSVDVVYNIQAGQKIRLGRIRVLGNRWTRDNVIRRAFRDGALPGEELDVDALRAGRVRLMQLRYFSLVRYGTGATADPWGLVKSTNADRPDEYDVELELEETDTRNVSFGAGISTDGGIFGFVRVTWRNFDLLKPPSQWWRILDKNAFRGGGQQFTLSFAPGSTFSSFTVAFADPRLNDSMWGMSFDVSRRLAAFDEYDQLTDGIYLKLSRFLDRRFHWRFTLDWSFRQVSLDNPDPTSPVNMLDQQGRSLVHSIGARMVYTRVRGGDPFLNGYRMTTSAYWDGGPLGGDIDLWKLEWNGSLGFRVWRNRQGSWQRARINMTLDWASAYDDTPEVPIFERYFLGGRNLRGFEFREVGPKSNGSPKGGEFRWTVVTQYTIPIADRDVTGFGINVHFFVDQGTLVEDIGDLTWDQWRIAAGIGIGIQFGSPNQPPLFIDFAWPLQKVDTDITQIVSVSFERKF